MNPLSEIRIYIWLLLVSSAGCKYSLGGLDLGQVAR